MDYLGLLNNETINITTSNISFTERRNGPEKYTVKTFYYCKDNCDSLLDLKYYNEIQRYADQLVNSSALWSQSCVRLLNETDTIDVSGCSRSAYRNITNYAPKRFIENWPVF